MLVLGIETSTPHTTVAVGTEQGILASALVSRASSHNEVVVPAVRQMLEWNQIELSSVAGIAVGLGPGLFTGMRVGIATARSLAHVLSVPIVGLASLDVLAFSVRYCRRLICAAVDGRRKEVFSAFYRPVPGGVTRVTDFEVMGADRLAADLEALAEDTLLVGDGALVYRRTLEEAGGHLEFASPAHAFPLATALVELAVPRFHREESDRLYDLRPIYVRRSDAEIAWDERARTT